MKFTTEQVQYNEQEFFRQLREMGKALLEGLGIGVTVFLIGVLGAFCLAQLLPRFLN